MFAHSKVTFARYPTSKKRSGGILLCRAAVLSALLTLGLPALSQQTIAMLEPEVPAPTAALQPAPMTRLVQPARATEAPATHRFWDRENSVLFAASAAFGAADFVVTRDNLRNGGQELNPVTKLFSSSTAGLAVNFAGETAGVIGLSYFLHKTGHHRMERAVSMLNIGASAGAVSFDLAHR
jgi:hypothetical protein